MFDPDRNQVRQFYCSLLRKHHKLQPLVGAELAALPIVLAHPEYHALLQHPDSAVERDYLPEHGETNPFLHLSLHLALSEQLSIDQPAGVRAAYQRLLTRLGHDEHAAQHAMIDCLAEMIWQSQRNGGPLSEAVYFACLNRKNA